MNRILTSTEKEVKISVDLGRTWTTVKKSMLLQLPLEKVKGDFIYLWDGKTLFKLAIASEHYYKLRMYNGFPILEIDGVRMQPVKHFKTPLDYSRIVVKMLGISKGKIVLDTCMGLGYTAIAAAAKGALVKTIEKDENVYELAKINPWSAELFTGNSIDVLRGSTKEIVKDFQNETFHFIIHDPPRFSHAGELYSLEFYRELRRIAKNGAQLFHYVGSVGKKKGRKIEKEVEKRLREAGWKKPKYDRSLQAVFAKKL